MCGLSRFDRVAPDVLEYAAKRGQKIHRYCERIVKGEIGWDDIDDDECRPYVMSYRKFVADTGWKPIASEMVVVSKRYRYAGTMDMIGRFTKLSVSSEQVFVLDLKATASLSAVTRVQTAGYAIAMGEQEGFTKVGRAAVQLRRDGKPRLKLYDQGTRDQNRWLSVLAVAHFQLEEKISSIGEHRA
jgi:hypothetical protein